MSESPQRLIGDVVLPCLNEAGALPWVLERVPPGWRAIVVDNGSRDGSAELAASMGALIVREPRRGFGSACHAGLTAATAPVVAFCDCDADLVLGRRRPVTFGAQPPHARPANLELARLVRRRTGLRLHDLGPLRAARREALPCLRDVDTAADAPAPHSAFAAAHARALPRGVTA